jgi:hypothetical protein
LRELLEEEREPFELVQIQVDEAAAARGHAERGSHEERMRQKARGCNTKGVNLVLIYR